MVGNKLFREEWIQWEPLKDLENFSSLLSTSTDFEGLKIIVAEYKNPKRRILVHFDGFVASYRDTNESYRLKLMHDLRKKYPNWANMGRFFKVKNSKYLQWIREQSQGISDFENLMHFVIDSNDTFFEIIAGFDPKVEFLDE